MNYPIMRNGKLTGVFIIESDYLWAQIVSRTISRTPGFVCIGSTPRGQRGISRCRQLKPDIVVAELWLPDMDGIDMIDELQGLPGGPRIIVFSARSDEYTFYRTWFGGVEGFIWKTPHCFTSLRNGLEKVQAGSRFFTPEVVTAIQRFTSSPDAFFKLLSRREMNLLSAFARGLADQDIAEREGLSKNTVHVHRTRIMAKLGLHRAQDLIEWAFEKGLRTQCGCVISEPEIPRSGSPSLGGLPVDITSELSCLDAD